MITTINECGHCGIEYSYHMSGSHIPNHNSDVYCNECEEARYNAVREAFDKIPILFKDKYIETDEITLKELLKIEKYKLEVIRKENKDKERAGEMLFPLMTRVYSNLYNSERREYSKFGYVEHEGRNYSYLYWPSKPEEGEVKVRERIDMKTGEPVKKFKIDV